MRKLLQSIMILSLGVSTAVWASDGSVQIIAPADGATVNLSDGKVEIYYFASFNPKGDHIHLVVDGKDREVLEEMQMSRATDIYEKGKWVDVMREINGKTVIPLLTPGTHQICAIVVNSAHQPIDPQACIHIEAKLSR